MDRTCRTKIEADAREGAARHARKAQRQADAAFPSTTTSGSFRHDGGAQDPCCRSRPVEFPPGRRSEERRVGKEGGSGWSPARPNEKSTTSAVCESEEREYEVEH